MRHLLFIITLIITSCSSTPSTDKEIKIDLRGRRLTEIPDSVFRKQNLTYLDLGSISPVSFPPLSALVDSNANFLTVLPDKIGELTKLRTLILNSNQLTRLPDSIINLSNLEILDLSMNRDLEIILQIDKLRHLPNLKVLKIADTKTRIDDLKQITNSLPGDTKIIVTIHEYFETLK